MRHAVWVGAVAVLATGGSVAGQDRQPSVITKLDGHIGGVSALAFNPKLPFLATGAGNGVVRVWDTRTGDLAARMPPQKPSGGRVQQLQFSTALSGRFLSSSSHNAVIVWDLAPPPPPKREMPEPKDVKDAKPPEVKEQPAPRRDIAAFPFIAYEDGLGYDRNKIGTVTGDSLRVYLAATEGVRIGVSSQVIRPEYGENTTDEFKGIFIPLALDAAPNADSSLVAMYGTVKAADRTEVPVVGFAGVSDARYVGRGVVRGPVGDRPPSIKFSPDGKMLVACNGEDVMVWRVPRSELVEGDPRILAGIPAFAVAPGPNGLLAIASPPEGGKKVKVTVADLSGAEAKILAVYATDIDRVSALAFKPDGTILAVADDLGGVVQLWDLEKK